MVSPRLSAAAAQFTADLWWVTGGHHNGSTLDTTELYNANTGAFASYVDLPKPMEAHNVVALNETHMVLLGGHSPTNDAYLFDRYELNYVVGMGGSIFCCPTG